MRTSAERERDKRGMLDPKSWPMWPVLPMKRDRVSGPPELGIVTADFPEIVVHVNLFETDTINLVLHQLARDGDVEVAGVKTSKYQDVDGVLDDGWVVD